LKVRIKWEWFKRDPVGSFFLLALLEFADRRFQQTKQNQNGKRQFRIVGCGAYQPTIQKEVIATFYYGCSEYAMGAFARVVCSNLTDGTDLISVEESKRIHCRYR
jgi:hypothetical protein